MIYMKHFYMRNDSFKTLILYLTLSKIYRMSTIRLSNDFKFSKRKFSQNESSYRGINLWTSRSVDAADSMVQRMTVKCFLTISHLLDSSGLLSISNIPSASPGKLLPAQVLTLLSAKRTCLRREKKPKIDKIFRIQTKKYIYIQLY